MPIKNTFATAITVLLGATAASAGITYEDNFNSFVSTFWLGIGSTQNVGNVTIFVEGDESATTIEGWEIALLPVMDIRLTTLASKGDLELAISYWDDAFNEYDWDVLAPVTGAGVFGGLGSTLANPPPVQATLFRVRVQMTEGTAILDHLTLTQVPEPGTAALIVLGLLAMAISAGLRHNTRRQSERAGGTPVNARFSGLLTRGNTMLSFERQFRTYIGICLLGIVLGISTPAQATPFELFLTPTDLGLATVDGGSGDPTTVNYKSEILDDQSGLRTDAPGVSGSYLEVNGSMLADDKVNGDHFVTITAETHSDNTINVPPGSDYYFGVVTLTDQKNSKRGGPDPGNLGGLGVRAFEDVDEITGLRLTGEGGNAEIGGSKEVSGGSDFDRDFLDDPNGSPHVDELVNFNFDGIYEVNGKSIDLFLTKVKFDNKDDDAKGLRVALQISVLGIGDILNDGSCSMSQLDPSLCKIYDTVNDPTILVTDPATDNVTVNFDAISELSAEDIITEIRISALDDDTDPENLKGTAEHFLINGLSGEFTQVPEPSTGFLMTLGLVGLTRVGQRRNRTH